MSTSCTEENFKLVEELVLSQNCENGGATLIERVCFLHYWHSLY